MDQFRETIATVIYPCYSSGGGESEGESAEVVVPESAGFPVSENNEDIEEVKSDQANLDTSNDN
jgi:hypothetical protein